MDLFKWLNVFGMRASWFGFGRFAALGKHRTMTVRRVAETDPLARHTTELQSSARMTEILCVRCVATFATNSIDYIDYIALSNLAIPTMSHRLAKSSADLLLRDCPGLIGIAGIAISKLGAGLEGHWSCRKFLGSGVEVEYGGVHSSRTSSDGNPWESVHFTLEGTWSLKHP